MEYLISFLLLIFNLIHYEHPLGSAVFFVIGTALVAAMFYAVYTRTKCYLTTCLIMMCYTWQISWVNIFGTATEELQLPWFYVIGTMMLAYAVVNFKKCFARSYNPFGFLVFVVFIVEFNVPLILSKSKTEGLHDYILIAFFVVLVFVAYLFSDTVSSENYDKLKIAFIWAVFTTSVCLIFQYLLYVLGGVSLFKMEVMPSFSGEYQVSCYLLMEDHSCSTIMLGCGVFYILERLSKKNIAYLLPALVITGAAMAMTSRRTSSISLLLVLALYVFLHYKGLGKKTLYIFAFTLLGMAFLYYITITRPVDSISQLLDDNGRMTAYIKSLQLLWKNPIGVGYGDTYLSTLTGGIIPHNTVLRWLAVGGYPFAAAMLCIIAYAFIAATKKGMTAEFWVIIYSFVASSFIPDIMNARFFVIPCMMAFLYSAKRKEKNLLLE